LAVFVYPIIAAQNAAGAVEPNAQKRAAADAHRPGIAVLLVPTFPLTA
jgi:hypothetical protein